MSIRWEVNQRFNSKQQAFLDFVLSHYVAVGVDEIDQDKLTPLLRLQYTTASPTPSPTSAAPTRSAASSAAFRSTCTNRRRRSAGSLAIFATRIGWSRALRVPPIAYPRFLCIAVLYGFSPIAARLRATRIDRGACSDGRIPSRRSNRWKTSRSLALDWLPRRRGQWG